MADQDQVVVDRLNYILNNCSETQIRYIRARMAPDCKSDADAARAVNIKPSTKYSWDNVHEINEAVGLLRMEQVRTESLLATAITRAARRILQEYTIDAAVALISALTEGGHVGISAAREILDRGGIPAVSRSEIETTEPVSVIILDE